MSNRELCVALLRRLECRDQQRNRSRSRHKCMHITGVALLSQLLWLAATVPISTASDIGGSGKPHTKHVLNESTPWQIRCASTLGSWCSNFHDQTPVAWKPAPRGFRLCPKNCNGVGVCNADTGTCMCPAGWKGYDCRTRQLRPCTNKRSTCDDDWSKPLSNVDANGRDLNPFERDGGYGTSRCSGVCDSDIAMCWCDGYISPPEGSRPGTPPVNRTRQLSFPEFQLKNDKDGKPLGFNGERTYDQLYGPNGWCTAAQPATNIPCILDGMAGPHCDELIENYCINQCSGRGVCALGFCSCDPGWYGTDCSMPADKTDISTPSRIAQSKWLKEIVAEPPAAQFPPPKPTRQRPLIYIYDLDPLYNTKLLQYRIAGTWCTHRKWGSGNRSEEVGNWCYSAEQLMHESLVQSPHRTYDPDEADYFYVPFYSSCLIYPVWGHADHPKFAAHEGPRVSQAAMAMLQVQQWLATTHPYWNKRNGRDHIWLFTHDEGACWAPNAVANSIWLTHWGRMDVDHSSNTGWQPDNYNRDHMCSKQMDGWTKFIKGHVCYNATKDLVVPAHRAAHHYGASPLMGKAPVPRTMLLFFKGDVGQAREPQYSRGIRQKLYRLSKENNWREKYSIMIGGRDLEGEYSDLLSRAKFCLVAPGDGWSPRLEDAILHGCVPLIIKDNVQDVFESIMAFPKFSVRVAEADVAKVPEILMGITPAQLVAMQQNLARVWHRFRWGSAKYQIEMQRSLDTSLAQYDAKRTSEPKEEDQGTVASHVRLLPRPFRGDVRVDDAFSTIMQWLYERIPFTR